MNTVSVIPDGELVYGIQLPIQALSVMTGMPWEREAGPADLLRVAQTAEAADFFYVAVCDHIAIPRDKAETMSTTWFHPVATLGWLAGQTERVRLMTNVFVPAYRHPLETAKAFATLDHLSGGRVILGVGVGHVEGEFEALGISFADRGAITNDAIDGILDAWTNEYVGDVGLRPRPGPAAASADLGRGLVEARVATRGRAWRRLDPAGDAAQADARLDRVPARAPRPGAAGSADRDRDDHRARLPR